jgi:exopolysaccharide production protein ExoY
LKYSQSYLNPFITRKKAGFGTLKAVREFCPKRGIHVEQITSTRPARSEEVLTSSPGECGSSSPGAESAIIAYDPPPFYYFMKRLVDIVVALFGLILLMPFFLIIALCIKLDDGGDILYFREVVGQHGKCFSALKFRTMIPHADVYLEQRPELMQEYQKNMKLVQDPRITHVGQFLRRTSLDEFPQLFNVLLGQMTLVGPRIIHPSELPRFGKFSHKRLAVKPGITGLWQISGRQHISYDERVLLDMNYIDTRSCFNDLLILFKTLKVLYVHTGA